ncbi:MAG: hypothetical protein R3B70_25365 [Polyangiaceae bacterium]
MIRIRDAQEEALSEALWGRFQDELTEHLTATFPSRCASLPEPRLAELVASAVVSARAQGMAGDRTIKVYAECALVFGPPPWREPFGEPLADRGSPPEVRHARFVRLANEALEPERGA